HPMIREALSLASPTLLESLPGWHVAPESKTGQKIERALVRYFQRMASRATPFAMFSSCSLGRVGEQTRLVMAPATEARVAVDLDYPLLDSLARQLSAAPQLRAQLRHWTNSTLHRAGADWRFVERGDARGPLVSSVEAQPELDALIERARSGASVDE